MLESPREVISAFMWNVRTLLYVLRCSFGVKPGSCPEGLRRMVARRLGQAARRRAAASDRAALDVSRRLPMVKRHAATVMRRAVRLAFLHANLSRHVLGPWSFGSQRMHWWQCDARWVGDWVIPARRKKSVRQILSKFRPFVPTGKFRNNFRESLVWAYSVRESTASLSALLP